MANKSDRVRGVDFISAPKVRSTRTRYVKSPLVRERRGLLAWLARLLGRRVRPFAGSTIAEEIDGGLLFSARVLARDPHTSLAPGSTTVESATGRLLGYAREACTRADNALDEIDDNLRQEEHWLDDCRPENIVKTLRAELDKAERETSAELARYTRRLVAARTEFEAFRARHRLDDDVRYGKPFDFSVVGQLGVLFLLEFVLNSAFQASVLKGGLLAGVTFAGFTSMATILIGVFLGLGAQLRRQPLAKGGWLGYTLLALFAGVCFVFISLLTLMRVAGDAGDLNPIETARAQISANLLAGLGALLELPALAYAIFVVALIAGVAVKFLSYAGQYPGYRKHGLHLEKAGSDLERLRFAASDEIRELGDQHNQKLHRTPDFIVSCTAPIRTLAADHENAIDQYDNDRADIATAARLFDSFIGEHTGGRSEDLETRTRIELDRYAERLAARHQAFLAKADQLCRREDVSDASIESARQQFATVLRDAQAHLDANEKRLLDEERIRHHAEMSWRPPNLAVAAE